MKRSISVVCAIVLAVTLISVFASCGTRVYNQNGNENSDDNTYEVIFTDDGQTLFTEKVQKSTRVKYRTPLPKDGFIFDSWLCDGYVYDFDLPVTKDITLEAVWSPVPKSMKYFADGVCVDEQSYIDGDLPSPPEVPFKEGYYGYWSEPENGERYAQYLPLDCMVVFLIDGEQVGSQEIKYGGQITFPSVELADGFFVKWGEPEYEDCLYTVKGEITPCTYTATFIADGKIIATVPFTMLSEEIEPPEIPFKDGYTGVWQAFSLAPRDITIYAEYTPIEPEPQNGGDKEASPDEENGESGDKEDKGTVSGEEGGGNGGQEYTEGLIFEKCEDGYRISGYDGTETDIVIPTDYLGEKVTEIGARAFADHVNIISVVVPDSVKRIEARAFAYCTSLAEIELGEGLESIGDYAFSYCSAISVLRLPASITSVGRGAFTSCMGLSCAYVPNSLSADGLFPADCEIIYY